MSTESYENKKRVYQEIAVRNLVIKIENKVNTMITCLAKVIEGEKTTMNDDYWKVAATELQEDNKKLREALKDVIGMLDDPTGSEHVRDMRAAAMIARRALKA
mgnify:CR=1 FL=1